MKEEWEERGDPPLILSDLFCWFNSQNYHEIHPLLTCLSIHPSLLLFYRWTFTGTTSAWVATIISFPSEHFFWRDKRSKGSWVDPSASCPSLCRTWSNLFIIINFIFSYICTKEKKSQDCWRWRFQLNLKCWTSERHEEGSASSKAWLQQNSPSTVPSIL